jgi:AcrR family transcriptional regulator
VYLGAVPALRERKKAQTRDAIERAAIRLFDAQGYEATTVDQIADAADVSVRTFYRYFDSKDAVIFARFDDYLEGFCNAIRDRACSHDSFGDLAAVTENFASELEDERTWLLAYHRLISANPALLLRSLQDHLRWQHAVAVELAREAGVGPDDLRVNVLASAFSGAFRSGLTAWQRAGGATPLRVEVARANRVLADLPAVMQSLSPSLATT